MDELCGVCGAYWECEHAARYKPLLEPLMRSAKELANVVESLPVATSLFDDGHAGLDKVSNGKSATYVESWADTLTDADYANAIVAQYDSTLDFTLDLLTGEANT